MGIPLSYLFLASLGYPFKWAKTRPGVPGAMARHGDGVLHLKAMTLSVRGPTG